MVRNGSRSRKRQRTRGRSRKRRYSRGRRDSRSRSRYHVSAVSRRSSSDERCDSRSGSRVRDRRDSCSTEGRRSRSRDRRKDRSRSDSRTRRRYRSRNRSHVRSRSFLRDRSCERRRHRSRDGTRDELRSRLHDISETHVERGSTPIEPSPVIAATPRCQPSLESGVPCSEASTLAHALVQTIKAMQPAKSQNYYVSNFDPSINNIEAWCEEVDRARDANGWNDHECLSRVASCLKGDAKVWLSEWVTNDRTWSNFKLEFKPLCPSKLDYANILLDAMNNTSDKYPTFAEYARRTLLRLRIVQGLSDDLRTLIVIRGIDSPQVRAAAANANLTPDTIVSFLSIYTKPNFAKRENSGTSKKQALSKSNNNRLGPKCFTCNLRGHVSRDCKRSKPDNTPSAKPGPSNLCTFCKKQGHTEDSCFAKARSEPRNQRNINFCSHRPNFSQNSDITPAVVDGVPVDVLIDSGALDVSLISSDVVKYISGQPKPRRCVLKGISDKEIVATSFVTATVEFSDISVEVDLVVVPAVYMNAPIIIGTDVLNRDGITYVRTKDRQYLMRSTNTCLHINSVEPAHQPKINTPLQGEELESLMSVINEFSDFLISGTAATTVRTGEMEIKLTKPTPVVYRPYKLSYQEKLIVREITKDLLEKGIIRHSNSEFASPIILVKKRDGSDRLCVDYRALNRITVKDRYPLPLIDDHIDRLGGSKYFSSLDMATGFHQIPLKEESIHLTGFVTPEDHFEYVKMPYGLANSPIVYQRIINNTLRDHINKGNVLVYVDDVLLLSNTVDDGIELLREVLKTLTEAGFSINLRKCSFLVTEVEYLGKVISQGQVRPSPRKVEALANTTPPENVKQVRQFLGLAGYFRRYIKDYASLTAPIAHLTRKDAKFAWTPECEAIRKNIIQHLTSEPVLAIFDPNLPTEVHTDASAIGYGAILLQVHSDATKRVVAYFSRSTQGAESKYHSYELETLAVVKALQNFRHYLVGLKFVVVTDCNALKSTERKKDLLPRVARWWIYLQDFEFSIEYRKGVMMPHADYLSRNPVVSVNQISRPRNWAQIAQAADNEVKELVQKLQDGEIDATQYSVQNGILYYKYVPVGEQPRLLCYVPKGHRLSLLRVFHDEHEHIGAEKTLDLILRHFWFPGLRQFVGKYVGHCLVCISQKRVPRAPLQNITSWEKPETPFHTVHVDALGPLPVSEGYKFVLLIVDAFTKYSLLFPIYRQDSTELKRVITQAISLFGVPSLMITDKGRMFESNDFVTWINELGCNLHYITPEMHHANGQAERYMRTVLNMLRIQANHKNVSWSDTLWKLQLVLNITKQKTTQVSPLNLLIGTEATTPVIRALVRDVAVEDSTPNREALREITRSRARQLLRSNQTSQDERVNRRRRPPRQFNLNDHVFVIKFSQSTGKLDPGMRGPYKVVEVLPSGRYSLRLLSGGYGKTTQAAAQHMVPWRGEWCPETCAAFFENEHVDESETALAGPSNAADPSMPLLDADMEAGPAPNVAGPSGTTCEDGVEDDTQSGEAV
ncbi:hypothetical protein ABMA28_003662 [Loxostege sticticalis]|uniref:RNA-directed DNA polymerase n=1 Tax=Loxostege sticticalis TaxID=481309 RepID=A0ABD0SZ94_LOXSC